MDQVAQECIDALAKAKGLPAESITPASTLEELGLDSLDRVSLAFDLEEKYEVEIPEHRLASVQTVGDIVHELEQAIDKKAAVAVSTGLPQAGAKGTGF